MLRSLTRFERSVLKKLELRFCGKAKWGRAHSVDRPAKPVGSPLVRDMWPGGTRGTPQRQLVKRTIKMYGKDVRVRYG